MSYSPNPEERARTWLMERLDEADVPPHDLASMPKREVLARLREEHPDAEAAVERIAARATGEAPGVQAAGVRDRRDERGPVRTPHRSRRWPVPLASFSEGGLVVVSLLAIGLLYLVMLGFVALQPEHRDLIVLDRYHAATQQSVQRSGEAIATWGEEGYQPATDLRLEGIETLRLGGIETPLTAATSALADFRAGWRKLLDAPQDLAGVTYGYDKDMVRDGVDLLERTYQETRSSRILAAGSGDPSRDAFLPLGQIAFYLAQGRLMLDDPAAATRWLRVAVSEGDDPWATESERLLLELASSD